MLRKSVIYMALEVDYVDYDKIVSYVHGFSRAMCQLCSESLLYTWFLRSLKWIMICIM